MSQLRASLFGSRTRVSDCRFIHPILVVALLVSGWLQPCAAETLDRIASDLAGRQGNGDTYFTSIEPTGRFVLSASVAGNIVPGAPQGIYLRELETGVSENVHVSSAGETGTCCGYRAYASADAVEVAFSSSATNLVSGVSGARELQHAYVRDRSAAATSRISSASGGAAANDSSEVVAVSRDGRFVLFNSRATDLVADTSAIAVILPTGFADYTSSLTPFGGCFIHDRNSGTTELVSKLPGSYLNTFAYCDGMSADGSRVVFHTSATGIDPADGNGASDVFLADRSHGTTVRLRRPGGAEFANGIGRLSSAVSFDSKPVAAITPDGDFVGFVIRREGLFRFDVQSGQSTRISGDGLNVFTQPPSISADGSKVVASFIGIGPALVDANTGAMKNIGIPKDLYDDLNFGLDILVQVEPSSLSDDGSKLVFISHSKYFNRGYEPRSGQAFDLSSEPFLVQTAACAQNPGKMFAGLCGCGFPEQDANSDGVIDCGSRPGRVSSSTVIAYPPFPIEDRARWILQQFLGAQASRRSAPRDGSTLTAHRAEAREHRLVAKVSPRLLDTFYQFVANIQRNNGTRTEVTVTQPVRSNVVDLTRRLPRGTVLRNIVSVRYRVIARDSRGRTKSQSRFGPALNRPKANRRQ